MCTLASTHSLCITHAKATMFRLSPALHLLEYLEMSPTVSPTIELLYNRATMVLAVVLPLSCSKRLHISTALSSSPPVSSSVETKYLASFNDRNLYRLDGEYQYGSFRVPTTSRGN